MIKEFVCICCPMGCRLSVTLNDSGEVEEVSGNTCIRGKNYAISEVTAPTRMITTTIKTPDGVCVPVKTKEPIPKGEIFSCMEEIKKQTVELPVHVGDIVLRDVAGTGVDIVATRSL